MKKIRQGWPEYLKAGYETAAQAGFGCKAHAGEGIGIAHFLDAIRTLPITRVAHGFQIMEDPYYVQELKERNITLVMSPIINLVLGTSIHKNNKKHFIANLSEYLLLSMLRVHDIKITFCSDNPQMAEVPITTLFKLLSGISVSEKEFPYPGYGFDSTNDPITGKELINSLIYGIECAFCNEDLKHTNINKLSAWVKTKLYKNKVLL